MAQQNTMQPAGQNVQQKIQPQMPQPNPQQPIQAEQPMPEQKKSGWKKWLVITLIVILVLGLGFYFKIV